MGAPRASAEERVDREAVEVDLLLEGLFRVYGLDFRQYARASLRRRVLDCVRAEKVAGISELQALILKDPDAAERLALHLSVTATTMFRDPSFFIAFRERVVPLLFAYPFVRIWHAGCSSGEEVYSVAILLAEEGLYERSRIYATDVSPLVVEAARAGVFPLEQMQEFTANYQRAGGRRAFSDYYTAQYERAIFRASLKKNIVFAQHNLVTDGSFNEFNVVLCRNVMIYFGPALQARVHELLYSSLRHFGLLALGRRETILHTPHEADYEPLDERERIYRRTA